MKISRTNPWIWTKFYT